MKIVIIDASDAVGRAVTEALSRKHEVARVGCTQGDCQVDITPQESIEALFEKVGRVDTIVSATGNLFFGPLPTMTDQDFNQRLQGKLLDQVRLALTGQHFLNAGGSITSTSGIIAHEPIAQRTNAATTNAGLEEFIRTMACELDHDQHINLASPTVLSESTEAYDSFFPDFGNVSTTTVTNTYRRSMEGIQTGCVCKVGH